MHWTRKVRAMLGYPKNVHGKLLPFLLLSIIALVLWIVIRTNNLFELRTDLDYMGQRDEIASDSKNGLQLKDERAKFAAGDLDIQEGGDTKIVDEYSPDTMLGQNDYNKDQFSNAEAKDNSNTGLGKDFDDASIDTNYDSNKGYQHQIERPDKDTNLLLDYENETEMDENYNDETEMDETESDETEMDQTETVDEEELWEDDSAGPNANQLLFNEYDDQMVDIDRESENRFANLHIGNPNYQVGDQGIESNLIIKEASKVTAPTGQKSLTNIEFQKLIQRNSSSVVEKYIKIQNGFQSDDIQVNNSKGLGQYKAPIPVRKDGIQQEVNDQLRLQSNERNLQGSIQIGPSGARTLSLVHPNLSSNSDSANRAGLPNEDLQVGMKVVEQTDKNKAPTQAGKELAQELLDMINKQIAANQEGQSVRNLVHSVEENEEGQRVRNLVHPDPVHQNLADGVMNQLQQDVNSPKKIESLNKVVDKEFVNLPQTQKPDFQMYNLSDVQQIIKYEVEHSNPLDSTLYKDTTNMYHISQINMLPNYKNPCWYEKTEMNDVKLQCLPYFFLAGMSGCGIDALLEALLVHHQIVSPFEPKPNWWNNFRFHHKPFGSGYLQNYGIASDMIQHFISKTSDHIIVRKKVTYDASPELILPFAPWKFFGKVMDDPKHDYLFTYNQLKRILPNAKFLIIVCDPVERLYTWYNTDVEHGHELFRSPQDFHSRVERAIHWIYNCTAEHKSSHACHFGQPDILLTKPDPFLTELQTGFYGFILQQWYEKFDGTNIKVIKNEAFMKNTIPTMHEVVQFLDLEPLTSREESLLLLHNKQRLSKLDTNQLKLLPMLDDTKYLLQSIYKLSNEMLASFVGVRRFDYNFSSYT